MQMFADFLLSNIFATNNKESSKYWQKSFRTVLTKVYKGKKSVKSVGRKVLLKMVTSSPWFHDVILGSYLFSILFLLHSLNIYERKKSWYVVYYRISMEQKGVDTLHIIIEKYLERCTFSYAPHNHGGML